MESKEKVTLEEAATEQRKNCCSQCPFARTTSKEYLDTRGYNGDRFTGQALMNALLPCHMDSEDNNAVVGHGRQCAGAAKFRANVGVGEMLRPEIGRLDSDHETVFSSTAELLAHHRGCSVEEAKESLKTKDEVAMVYEEMQAALEAGKFIPQ